MDKSLARALDVCLQKLQAGEELQQALEPFPQYRQQLLPLLEVAEVAHWYARTIQISMDVQALSRSNLVQAVPYHKPPIPSLVNGSSSQRSKLISLALALLVILATTLIIITARQALPGNILYPLKIAIEKGRLQLTSDPLRRIGMEQAFDQDRLEEVKLLLQTSRLEEVKYAGGLTQMGTGDWQVAGIRLIVPPKSQIVGNVEEGIYVIVEGEIQADGSILAYRVLPREYSIQGKLQNYLPDRLTVAGIPVVVTVETLVHGSPQVGNPVKVSAFLRLDGNLQARLVEASDQFQE